MQKRKAIFEEFIKNDLCKAENVLKINHVLHTAIIHKTRPLPVAPLHQERVLSDISYSKCTE
jgi:hypothetical protein